MTAVARVILWRCFRWGVRAVIVTAVIFGLVRDRNKEHAAFGAGAWFVGCDFGMHRADVLRGGVTVGGMIVRGVIVGGMCVAAVFICHCFLWH